MDPTHHFLHLGDQLDLACHDPGRLHVLHAIGRGIQADMPSGWISAWWSVRGRLLLSASGNDWELASGRLQVWRETSLRARSLDPHGWLALCGSPSSWIANADAASLFPWQGRISRATAGLFARLARTARQRSAGLPPAETDALRGALAGSLLEQQRALQALLPRCSGRTLARRRQTLLRMLRVRHAIDSSLDVRLDLDALAATASYSPCHLIRVFRTIFDETPFEYATRLRAERAWQLVRDTRMPVCEITEAVGFESQSAFCRAFKNTYGMTTSEARHRLNDDRCDAPQAA